MPHETALELLDDAHGTIMRLAHGAERLALANGDGTARQVADAYKRAAAIITAELRPAIERLVSERDAALASALAATRRAYAIRDVVAKVLEDRAAQHRRNGDAVVELALSDAAAEVRALPLPEAPAPVAWGAMPTVSDVEAHRARAEQYAHGGAPWLRRYVAFDGSPATGIEIVYLTHERGRVWLRRPTSGVTYLPSAREVASDWRPIDADGCAAPRGAQ